MKIKYLLLTMVAALIAGCSEELDRGGVYNPEKGVTATIPAYSFDDGTRVNISDDLQTFTWSDGDEIGIYYADTGLSADARFKILQGGSSTGNFSNDVFYLNNNKAYYSFYPYQPYGEIDSVPVDYTGQIQNGNGSATHLGAYNYMYGTVNITNNGGASIAYKNLGSVMQLQLTVSNVANYTGIDITSDGVEFITKGTASMVDGTLTATETSATIHLDLEDGIALNAGDVLTANILTAPVDLSGNTLTITLTEADGKIYEVTTSGKNMLQGKAFLYAENVPDSDGIPYITFTADAEQTLKMSYEVPTLEYSVNDSEWSALGTTLVTFGGSYGDLRLRGQSSTGTITPIYTSNKLSFGNKTKVACSGDIRTLIDYENYSTVSTSSARFAELFVDCTQLISAPELPATELADKCYYYMFYGCTSLTKAPELPATTLTDYCYSHMFSGCTSLAQGPELPATNLADYCYGYMFQGCTSLTQAPELPATNLASHCYQAMFSGCTSLTQVPELPATTLADECYNGMFSSCTSLTKAPELPATTLASFCYESMFSNCTSLTKAPELPTTTLAFGCYRFMFDGCTSLTQAPELPATTVASHCYQGMFQDCTSLTKAPELPATTLTTRCYYEMFYDCSKLNYIKMMATDISAKECIDDWVYGVPSTGTFVKNKNATWNVGGDCGIPSGWRVVKE